MNFKLIRIKFRYWKKWKIYKTGNDSLVTGEVFFALINKGYISRYYFKWCKKIFIWFRWRWKYKNETISYVSFISNMNINRNLDNKISLNLSLLFICLLCFIKE